ncbi:MAG TPA: hypothetical protein ENN46_00685 [Candidatus Woesearchaeota archaeon]|nr:hypothetical protein [Candidatus Woesearchaeota archaeon]
MTTVIGDFARRNKGIKSIKKSMAHFMYHFGADIDDIRIVICSTKPATERLLKDTSGMVKMPDDWKAKLIDMMIKGYYYSQDKLFNSIPLDSINRRTGHWGNVAPAQTRGPGLYDDLHYFKHKEKAGKKINLDPSQAGSYKDPSSCFIATAAYGDKNTLEIQVLRKWRDDVLLRTPFGQALVNSYYSLSPPIAGYIRERDSCKKIVRALLKPIILILKKKQKLNP